MSAPIPPLPPGLQSKVDQFHAAVVEIFDRYVHGIEMDMNRHAVKHGAMDDARALNDVTRILARDVPANMLAGMAAEAILREIRRKRKGKG